MTLDALLEGLDRDDLARLSWRLCRLFGVAPWSRLGRALDEATCLELAAHLVLDQRPQTSPGSGDNPGFDPARFLALKGAAK